jgi:hypothetical protein
LRAERFCRMAVARVSRRPSLIKNAVVALAFLGSATASVHAEDANRITVLEENDSLYFNSDKHHTQGLRVSNLGPALRAKPPDPTDRPYAGWLFTGERACSRRRTILRLRTARSIWASWVPERWENRFSAFPSR